MSTLSPMHLILIVLVALLLFGPKKLPELGRGVGKMLSEFKDATKGGGGNADNHTPEPQTLKKEFTATPSQEEFTRPTSGS